MALVFLIIVKRKTKSLKLGRRGILTMTKFYRNLSYFEISQSLVPISSISFNLGMLRVISIENSAARNTQTMTIESEISRIRFRNCIIILIYLCIVTY